MGLVFLAAQMLLFFGTGVLLSDESHFLSGEGAWEVNLSESAPFVCQEFVPQYSRLKLVSFRMDMSDVTHWDGTVTVSLEDAGHGELWTQTLGYGDITDCAFTDVEMDLVLKRNKVHYLRIYCTPSSAGEYPRISVCGREYHLPESRTLTLGGEPEVQTLEGQQLVSRYQYVDALAPSKVRNVLLLGVLTALGIMFGLPRNRYIRRAAGAVILLAAPIVLGQRLELLTYDPAFYMPISMKWNVGIMYALELIVLLFTHSTAVSIVLTNVALTALYSANYFTVMYRGTSLRMNDFTAIDTAVRVVGDYDLTPDSHMAFAWAILLLIVVFGAQTGGGVRGERGRTGQKDGTVQNAGIKQKDRVYWIRKLVSYAVTAIIGICAILYGRHRLLYTDLLAQAGFADKRLGFSYELIYSYNGYLVATCVDMKNSRIVEPEGYSVERVEQLLTDARDGAPEADAELPHVILIMNESLSDLRVLGNLELSQDNLPFIGSLQENTIKGYTHVSTFGGGTANSEFEAFTGCSMAFFPVNFYPYQQAIRGPVDSMVSQMKANGYTAVSIHPERAKNWNRENIYQYYGFDRMLWKEDFEGAEEIHSGVSDAETYRRIIELYEERGQGEKLFVFDLTMQNHGGYEEDEAPYAVTALNLNEPQVDEYLSLVKISDEAFAELTDYFARQEEKVIICMFGDHQPWVSDLIVGESSGGGEVTEQILDKFKTVFVIWANYDIEEAQDCELSTNYLGAFLMRTAGIPMSPFFEFLEAQREDYPIVTTNGYVDSEGNYSSWGPDGTELLEYRMLQYNYLHDKNTVEWGY